MNKRRARKTAIRRAHNPENLVQLQGTATTLRVVPTISGPLVLGAPQSFKVPFASVVVDDP